ncbi:MAG: PilZ domain-containing protein [Deltaproteobacteria bacterium]|nr:PilZ domain-containing protein [Deltaproteobacteria bacterium]
MERRVVTRYNLQVPVQVETLSDEGRGESYEWKTRDVSSSGAFLLTGGQNLEQGTGLKVNIFLNSFTGSGSWVEMNGRVVRIEEDGVGVCFEGQYQFVGNAPSFDM